jgi:hypothetical protein
MRVHSHSSVNQLTTSANLLNLKAKGANKAGGNSAIAPNLGAAVQSPSLPLPPVVADPTVEKTSLIFSADAGTSALSTSDVVPGGNAPAGELTLKGLMNAWGQSDSEYDFDANGTVDVDDLLNFINNNLSNTSNPTHRTLIRRRPATMRPRRPSLTSPFPRSLTSSRPTMLRRRKPWPQARPM